MWLRKQRGGSGVGPFFWPEDGSVTEVPDERLAADLLSIPDGGYSRAEPPPKPAPKPAVVKTEAAPPAPVAAKAAPAAPKA